MVCTHGHRYDPKFDGLNDAQSGEKRHKCCGCAYDIGFNAGQNGLPNVIDLSVLPDSQAGTVRHKNAQEAFELGYTDGQNSINN
ncbi:hypothetical protein [Sulfurospirillum multivorans]|uniref:Uncharacterized protein n=2 Tax=Sulfurospirillum multivorans TaxID=66821 RepID=A0AA86DZQ0_SULMK|nr:hypothetical protein [Sulfurospirillum multivorans]AHJ13045.1 hypothetical protein SMUL_1790 [Sulfurospirillum multivorans DSM 12446]QEH06535.1 hypothetical protein SMN_1770 [Sulfurospirillum multivorans]